jgi:hypothetical protein
MSKALGARNRDIQAITRKEGGKITRHVFADGCGPREKDDNVCWP